jgi:hypothetical protein
MRHPNYRNSKGKLRPCLIYDVLQAYSLQGDCVYSGKVKIKQIISNDTVVADLLEYSGTVISAIFDPRNCRIQIGYTHDLYKE